MPVNLHLHHGETHMGILLPHRIQASTYNLCHMAVAVEAVAICNALQKSSVHFAMVTSDALATCLQRPRRLHQHGTQHRSVLLSAVLTMHIPEPDFRKQHFLILQIHRPLRSNIQ